MWWAEADRDSQQPTNHLALLSHSYELVQWLLGAFHFKERSLLIDSRDVKKGLGSNVSTFCIPMTPLTGNAVNELWPVKSHCGPTHSEGMCESFAFKENPFFGKYTWI